MARATGSYPVGHEFKSHPRYHYSSPDVRPEARAIVRTIGAHGPLVKRLRRHPFTVESWVRFPYGSPAKFSANRVGTRFADFVFTLKTAFGTYMGLILSFRNLPCLVHDDIYVVLFCKTKRICNCIGSLYLIFSEHMTVQVQSR